MIRHRLAQAAAGLVVLVMAVPIAHAKSHRDVSYPYDPVFAAAVRFLRIDEGHAITEKDRDAGYILFSIEDGGQRYPGALEIVRRKDARGRDAVRLYVRLSQRPAYMERALLVRLEEKLREQLGPPPPPPEPENEPSDKAAEKIAGVISSPGAAHADLGAERAHRVPV